jgi:hypothetical protein
MMPIHGCLPHPVFFRDRWLNSSAILPRSGTAATYFWSVRGGFTGQQDIA